jgi:hypothetical protein
VDHKTIAIICMRNLEPLQSLYQLCFYEEIPYRIDPQRTSAARRVLRGCVGEHQPVYREYVLSPTDLTYKSELAGFYYSQFGSRAAARTVFRRCTSRRLRVEAWWEIA